MNFKYCLKNGRKIVFIDDNYLNYISNELKKEQISFVIININYGYENILEYNNSYNKYDIYYRKGKRLVRNYKRINLILEKLSLSKDIELLKRVEMILDGS